MELPIGIELFSLGHDLTLVSDRNAGSFPESYAIVQGDLPETDNYERWWDVVKPLVIETDDRVLAVLVERVCDVEIGV